MKELQRNRDFLLALERGEKAPSEISAAAGIIALPMGSGLVPNHWGLVV